jgi:hypothetical protein
MYVVVCRSGSHIGLGSVDGGVQTQPGAKPVSVQTQPGAEPVSVQTQPGAEPVSARVSQRQSHRPR